MINSISASVLATCDEANLARLPETKAVTERFSLGHGQLERQWRLYNV